MTAELITNLQQQIAESKGKRIRSAKTHKQYIEEVLSSIVIEKRDDHLTPIVVNVIQRLVEFGNNIRLKKAAKHCMGQVETALRDDYCPVSSLCPTDWTCMSDSGFALIGFDCDEQGNITSEGSWEQYDCEENSLQQRLDPDKIALEQAVLAANRSSVFKTIGIELIVTDDLLIYGGMLL